jgi:hypothetical protein
MKPAFCPATTMPGLFLIGSGSVTTGGISRPEGSRRFITAPKLGQSEESGGIDSPLRLGCGRPVNIQ